MRRLVLLAPLALLAACSQSEPAPEPTEEAPPAESVVMAADGKPATGIFEVTSADGRMVTTQTVDADGTLTTVEADLTRTGTWTSTGPGNFCVDMAGDEKPTCYREEVRDGVYSSVNEENPQDAWTVKRLN